MNYKSNILAIRRQKYKLADESDVKTCPNKTKCKKEKKFLLVVHQKLPDRASGDLFFNLANNCRL